MRRIAILLLLVNTLSLARTTSYKYRGLEDWNCQSPASPLECYAKLTNQLSKQINSPACQNQASLIELPPPERLQLQLKLTGELAPYGAWTAAMNEIARKILYEALNCHVDFYGLLSLANRIAGYSSSNALINNNNNNNELLKDNQELANTLQSILQINPAK